MLGKILSIHSSNKLTYWPTIITFFICLILNGDVYAGGGNPSPLNRIMAIDQNGNAYSKDNESSVWYSQVGLPTTAQLIACGGTRMAVVASNGTTQTLWAKSNQTDGWLPIETGGVAIRNSAVHGQIFSGGGPQLSVGPTGATMVIDPAGDVYARLDNGSNQWVRQSSGGLSMAVAVGGLGSNAQGGDGRMMMIDWGGTAWSKDSLTGAWLRQSKGGGSIAHSVAVGTHGEMMIIDAVGDAYAKLNPTDNWTLEARSNGSMTKAIAVGGKGRMMVINSDGNAYSKDSLTATWIPQVTGAKAIAVGSSGRMVIVDQTNHIYYKDNTYDVWIPDPVSNYGSPLIDYISIN